MSQRKSSGRWMREHLADEFVIRAQREGYRSRAVYKLQEIDEREGLFAAGMSVVDLGAAPGGWCEYVSARVGASGSVVACDRLPMNPLPGVAFVQGDFTEAAVLEKILAVLGGMQADVVISDMSPNISGVSATDQARAMYLAELALEFALQVLRPPGALLAKVFQGEGFDLYLRRLREHFRRVVSRKPKASRSRSREVYLLVQDRKL